METVDIKDLKKTKMILKNPKATISRLSNGEILKEFGNLVNMIYKSENIDIEKRILNSKSIKDVPEIIIPNKAVYNDEKFVGYTMKEAKGINYNEYDSQLTYLDRHDLQRYGEEYLKLENIIKRGNKQNCVFPDLCSCDNIFIDPYKNITFIDYDGIQINNEKTLCISSRLGKIDQYKNKKYMWKNDTYTTELDKKSLINLYFLLTFNINLNMINKNICGKIVTIDEMFDYICLKDYDIMQKVWKTTQLNEKNEFLGNDVFNIAENYELELQDMSSFMTKEKIYYKKLVRK